MSRAGYIGRLLFGTREPVDRRSYLIAGVSLMAIKLAVECLVVWKLSGQFYNLIYSISPSYQMRESLARTLPPWVGWAWLIWTLAFLWIAVSMSVRRAASAGLSPWLGLGIVVPLVNFVLMVLLSSLPSVPSPVWKIRERDTQEDSLAMAISAAAAVLLGGLVLAISVYVLGQYGLGLFFGAPLMMGATSAYLYNRSVRRGHLSTVLLGIGTVLFGCGVLLLIALEGVICIVMALPMVVPMSILGAAIGKQIADSTHHADRGLMASTLVLLAVLPIESKFHEPSEYVVVSSTDIAASPAAVWEQVIGFPEIDDPLPLLFRLGIAAPLRARIEGSGVGAVRYCEFSTGAFVEPITVWEPASRLAFDVQDQPDPLIELSPYGHIHPPHLDGFMRSKRGEFRLIALPNGSTRLEGRTWYEVEMYPQAYWRWWCDTIIHQIHMRVLHHIAGRATGAG